MTYRIRGLEPTPFRHLIGLPEAELASHGAVRMTVDSRPGFPCRITLDDVDPGATVLLINHVSHADGPYRASHAIFVSEGAPTPADFADSIPQALDRRVLSLRAFDGAGLMADARLAQPGEADEVIRAMLGNASVHHIDAHNAVRGCFAARVDRA
ncbi:MAG: DUF1203 domain-containing protein [Sphingomicrobium sp.]